MKGYKHDKTDYTGKRFGFLTVLKRADKGYSRWLCRCDCGKIITVTTSYFFIHDVVSCGCRQKQIQKTFATREKETAYIGRIASKKTSTRNKSGVKGVCFDKSRKKWLAYICLDGKQKMLGRFASKDDAIYAREQAFEKYYQPKIKGDKNND